MNEKELISQAMAALGSRQSEAKRKAAQKNIQKALDARRKPLSELACTCGTDTGAAVTMEGHKSYCPRGRAIKRRSAPQPRE